MYKFTITLNTGKKIIFDSESNIIQGKINYALLNEDIKRFIVPDCNLLQKALSKCLIKSFSVSSK